MFVFVALMVALVMLWMSLGSPSFARGGSF